MPLSTRSKATQQYSRRARSTVLSFLCPCQTKVRHSCSSCLSYLFCDALEFVEFLFALQHLPAYIHLDRLPTYPGQRPRVIPVEQECVTSLRHRAEPTRAMKNRALTNGNFRMELAWKFRPKTESELSEGNNGSLTGRRDSGSSGSINSSSRTTSNNSNLSKQRPQQ